MLPKYPLETGNDLIVQPKINSKMNLQIGAQDDDGILEFGISFFVTVMPIVANS